MEDNCGGAATATATATATTGVNEVEDGNIRIKVSYGSNNFDVFTTPQSTFADLKRVIAKTTGLDPKEQNMLFRGKVNDDNESLHVAGVKDNGKVILIENSPTKEEDLEKVEEVTENIEEIKILIENSPTKEEELEKVEEVTENMEEIKISRGLEAVNLVREENNLFDEQVVSLETVVCSGTQVADKDFIFLTEMLMRQLLKLDGFDCEGEGRIQRKLEVRRVQDLVEKLDDLRTKNSNPTASNVPEKPDEPSLPSSSKVGCWLESLHVAGVKDNAKVILIENSSTKEEDLEKVEEVKESVEEISRGLEAVNLVREENNQFAEQVVSLETVVCSGTQIADKDFIFLTEMLMRQLLKLDGIDCEGGGRTQRKLEVRRAQGLVEKLDGLRVKNSNPTVINIHETPDEPLLPSSSTLDEPLLPSSSTPDEPLLPSSSTPDEPSLPCSSKVTQDLEILE